MSIRPYLRTSPQILFPLQTQPFDDRVENAFFFPSEQHCRVEEFMGRSLWSRSRLALITAEHGCGKSLMTRRLLNQLDERVVVASVSRKSMSLQVFLGEVLQQFGFMLADNDGVDRRRLLIERFLRHQASMRRICLLVVENAQNMHPAVLEELRFLATIESNGSRILKLLLLGEGKLTPALQASRLGELLDHDVMNSTLEAFSEEQTAAYVAHRLRAAGASDPYALISNALMPQIHACSGGVPLQINRLCERALSAAADHAESQVTTAVLSRSIYELGLRDRALPPTVTLKRQSETEHHAVKNASLAIAIQGLPEQHAPLLAERTLIGRGDATDIRIDSSFVSRYHALIVRDGTEHLLLDLGSTNGVLVNTHRVIRRVLRHRDLIQIGPIRVTYLNETALPASHSYVGDTMCFAPTKFPSTNAEPATSNKVLGFGRREPAGAH